MKIGVISDTHISANAEQLPQKIFNELKGLDMIIHAGDLTDLSVLDKLKAICNDVVAVWGNMDSPEVKAKLPQKTVIKAGKLKIGLTHGYGHPDNLVKLMKEIFKNDDVNLVIFGHSHLPLNREENGILYFNPGSPTDTVFAPYNSYGIIEIKDKIDARIVKI